MYQHASPHCLLLAVFRHINFNFKKELYGRINNIKNVKMRLKRLRDQYGDQYELFFKIQKIATNKMFYEANHIRYVLQKLCQAYGFQFQPFIDDNNNNNNNNNNENNQNDENN